MLVIIASIIVSIIIFSVIVLVHEWGHFYFARKFGVKVYEFGLGIPPRAKKLWTDKKGTLYSLNWFPLGGFVKLRGESMNTYKVYDKDGELHNNASLEKAIKTEEKIYHKDKTELTKAEIDIIDEGLKDNNAKNSLLNKPIWQQSIVLLAGVVMNFLLAFFIFTILFMVGVKPIGVNNKIDTNMSLKLIPTEEKAFEIGLLQEKKGVVLLPVEGSIAEKSGIGEGDILLTIGGEEVNSYEELKEIINSNPLVELDFGVVSYEVFDKYSSEDIKNIKIIPSEEGKIGSYLSPNIRFDREFEYQYCLVDSIKYGASETVGQIGLTFEALGMLVRKIVAPAVPEERQEAIESVAGPIGVVDLISKTMDTGIIFLIIIGAIISINLGVFNLLPVPALDGGRFFILAINGFVKKIFGKKAINERFENALHIGFFATLIILSIFIAYNDIMRIVNN